MSSILVVGNTRIPYRIRVSARATRKRIVVEPGSVEVVLPRGRPESEAHTFVQQKRRWLYAQFRRLAGVERPSPTYLSGSKVRYRGRWLTLEVEAGRSKTGSVAYHTRFHITLPRGTPKSERARASRQLLDRWSRQRLLQDGRRLARRYAAKANVTIADVAVVDMKNMWASCGKDAVIRLNPQLIELPKPILEYVLAHEVCHRIHRNHSLTFWHTVATLMPDWLDRQAWLDKYERDWAL